MGSFIVLKNPPNEQTNVCNPRSNGGISVCWLFAGVCLFAQNTYVSIGRLKMSTQMVFKCPAKLYTLNICTHNRIKEHPKGCSFSFVRITICIVTRITCIFENGEFTGLLQSSYCPKLFKVTRVTVTSPVRFTVTTVTHALKSLCLRDFQGDSNCDGRR